MPSNAQLAAAARATGQKTFTPINPCKRCGTSEYYACSASGRCVACQRAHMRKDTNTARAAEARAAGQVHYEPVRGCKVCKTKLYYTSSKNAGQCVECALRRVRVPREAPAPAPKPLPIPEGRKTARTRRKRVTVCQHCSTKQDKKPGTRLQICVRCGVAFANSSWVENGNR